MSTTVLAPSGLEITSNHESGQSMLDSLTKTPDKTPRVLVEKGEPVEKADEKDETSQAASVLGKKGGKAAAEARKEEAKAAKPAEEKPDAKEAKQGDDKAKDEKAAKGKAEVEEDAEAGKDKKGNPRHDPEARVEKLKADIAELARQKRELREEIEADTRRAPARTEAPVSREAKEAPAAEKPGRATFTEDYQDPNDPEPKLEDYDGDGAYERFVKDTGRWAARDENRKVQHQQAQESGHRKVAEHISTHVDTFHERITGIKKGEAGQTEGFGEFMAALPDALVSKLTPSFMIPRDEQGRLVARPGPTNLITDLIIKSEKPKAILEHFADNMTDFQRIAALRDPLQIAGEMAILSNRLDAVTADTSSQREVSRAGSPGRSVPGSPRAAEPNLTGELDFDEFQRRKRAAQK
jgi:hypothetical protein